METLTFKDRLARSKDSQRRALLGERGTRIASPRSCQSTVENRVAAPSKLLTSPAPIGTSQANLTEDRRLLASPSRADYLLYVNEFKRLVSVSSNVYGYSKASALEMAERIIGLGEGGMGQLVSAIRQWRVDSIAMMLNTPGLELFSNTELEQRARSQYRIDVLRCSSDENGKAYENWVYVP